MTPSKTLAAPEPLNIAFPLGNGGVLRSEEGGGIREGRGRWGGEKKKRKKGRAKSAQKIPPYRETPGTQPLSHCVLCGIADYGCYTPTSFGKNGRSLSKDRTWHIAEKLASEAYRAVGASHEIVAPISLSGALSSGKMREEMPKGQMAPVSRSQPPPKKLFVSTCGSLLHSVPWN